MEFYNSGVVDNPNLSPPLRNPPGSPNAGQPRRLNLTPQQKAALVAFLKTLTDPNLATVGLSEEAARERYGELDIYKTSFRALKLTLGEKKERTFMKLVVDRKSQRVVGAHMIGPDAGEIIQGLAIAVKLGATKAQFDATIGIHPTAAEEFVTLRNAF